MHSSNTIRLSGFAISNKGTQAVTSPVVSLRADDVSDECLIACVSEGNTEALAILFRRYSRLVRGVALRILRDASEADDLLQELFLFINRKASIFDPQKSSLRSWIVQMTYQRAIDRRRYLQARHFYTRADLDTEAMGLRDPSSDRLQNNPFLDAGLNKTELRAIFEELPSNQQETLRLYFFEGYTLREIAVALEQSLGNVRNHYYRALDRLRRQILSPGNKKTRKVTRK